MKREDGRRAALSRAVAVCRRALVGDRTTGTAGDLGKQLESPNGFDRVTGAPAPLEEMAHLRSWELATARMLREWHGHLSIGAAGATEAERTRSAYDQMKYELGYTVLHRLCALRMAEEREVVRECVRQGRDSTGFRTYLQLAGDSGLGTHEDAYTFFLARLYDELARDLPAVFDRRTAASLLTPSPSALTTLLSAINDPAIATLWTEDETLGWVFEDYNDADERKEMREHAPQNARELAVRNQFFTPRWVVEFLTDNTLGRLWYDLTAGQTQLREHCRFLLKPKDLPAQGCRDPRDLKILDPACGSGHFLLYVFDVLEIIYREAWRGRHHQSATFKPLWEDLPDEAAFEREIPALILSHNLYGVDIDPRCIQEAALALWLRAHRSWQALAVRPKDRPRIARVNLVCAQALPSTPKLRDQLRAELQPPILGQLVDTLFQNVAEMGLLLRAETAIRDTVEGVKKEYLAWKKTAPQRNLFGELVGSRQTTLDDFAKLRDEGGEAEFWRDADRLLLRAIEDLAEGGEDAEHYRNRLFAEGVRHELEFLDISRERFDAILMNPPFGEPSEGTKDFLDAAYPNAGHDLYAMFYERALEMLVPGGRVGAITNRAWLALPTLNKFRREVLGKKGTVEVAADFGYGVLNAKVETVAAVVLLGGSIDAPATWIRLVKTGRKMETLLEALTTGERHPAVSVVPARHFESLPSMVCGYWMSTSLAKAYGSATTVKSVADVKQGTVTGDDPRFLRLVWEVRPSDVGLTATWPRFVKGGEYRVFFDDVHLVMNWRDEGREIIACGKGRPQNVAYFGRPGSTWPRRTTADFGPRVLPSGVAFGDKGPSAFSLGTSRRAMLAVLTSTPSYLLILSRLGNTDTSAAAMAKSYEVGLVRDLPWPVIAELKVARLDALVASAVESVRAGQIDEDDSGETVVAFALPPSLLPLSGNTTAGSLVDATCARVVAREARLAHLAAIQAQVDAIVAAGYGFSERDRQVMDEELEPPLTSLPGREPIDEDQFQMAYLTKAELDSDRLPGGRDAEMEVRVEHRRKKQMRLRDEATLCRIFQAPPTQIAELRRRLGLLRDEDQERVAADIVSYAVGIAFGRWDLRLWAHPEWIPTYADPFDPMPACPLGQLVNGEGLPATEERIASEVWLAARRHPTTLPPSSEVTAPDYPLPVAWGGVIEDDTLDDARPRPPAEGLRARVEAVLQHLFGAQRADWEHDIAAALGAESITAWLRAPPGFFADHLSRYSKSRRQAPIYWPLSTASGGIVFWVYAQRFDAGTLPSIVNRLRTNVEALRDERDRLQQGAGADAGQLTQLRRLDLEIMERAALGAQLQSVLDWGYVPHPDDGFVVTAGPLSFAFRLPKWRDLLATAWNELETGELDWAHLAMVRRPREVLAKCVTDRSLAIAHGREDLFEAQAGKKVPRKASGGAPKKRARDAKPVQLAIPAAIDEGTRDGASPWDRGSRRDRSAARCAWKSRPGAHRRDPHPELPGARGRSSRPRRPDVPRRPQRGGQVERPGCRGVHARSGHRQPAECVGSAGRVRRGLPPDAQDGRAPGHRGHDASRPLGPLRPHALRLPPVRAERGARPRRSASRRTHRDPRI